MMSNKNIKMEDTIMAMGNMSMAMNMVTPMTMDMAMIIEENIRSKRLRF